MCASTTKPHPDDRAYYPTIRDIQNHVYTAKKALDLSKFDQQNLKMKIEAWEEQDPQSRFYFRPFVKAENIKKEMKSWLMKNLNRHYCGFTKLSGSEKC